MQSRSFVSRILLLSAFQSPSVVHAQNNSTYTFMVSFFELNGIPEPLSTSLTIVLFLVTCASIFSGQEILDKKFSVLSRKLRIAAGIVGSLGLLTMLFMFQPRWVSDLENEKRLPYCYIQSAWIDTDSYTVDWFSDSQDSVQTKLVSADGHEIADNNGLRTFDWTDSGSFLDYRILARNRFGTCEKSVTVWNPNEDWSKPLSCNLWLNKATASPGESYRLSWKVTGPALAAANINGQRVNHEDSATYTFNGPNYDRFHMRVGANTKLCETQARIVVSN